MPSRPRKSNAVWAALFCTAGGLSLMLVPEPVAARIRTTLQDLGSPGQRLVRAGLDAAIKRLSAAYKPPLHDDRIATLESQLRASELHCRQLRARAHSVEPKHKLVGGEFVSPIPTQPLLLPELVEARVMGSEQALLWHGRKLLGTGRKNGVEESLMVVEGPAMTIDQGSSAELDADDPVYDYEGRIVVGRIAKVGSWTSTLELVSDATFSGLGCVVHNSPDGWVPGPEGIVKGDGKGGCRMEVESTEPVQVGDAVWTVPEDGVLPLPMYYGRVTGIERKSGSLNSQLQIEPAVKDLRLRSVYVRRTRLNPVRLLTN